MGCESVKEVTEISNKKNNYCTSGLHLNTQGHLDPFGPWDPSPARTFPVIVYKSERPPFSFPLTKDDKHENKITNTMIQSSQLPFFSVGVSPPHSHGPRPASKRGQVLWAFFGHFSALANGSGNRKTRN